MMIDYYCLHRANGYQIRRRIYAVLATKTGQTRKTARTYAALSIYRIETIFDGPRRRHPSKYPFSTVNQRLFSPFYTVADTVFSDRTVILTVFVAFTKYEGHRLQVLI